MNPTPTDYDRAKFLQQLDASDLIVSDWESEFIGSFLSAGQPSTWFTPGRRKATDRMMQKYADDLGLSLKPAVSTALAPRPAALAGGCEYLVREDNGRQPCNAAAIWRALSGMRYCQRHAEMAQEFCRKAKRAFSLVKIK